MSRALPHPGYVYLVRCEDTSYHKIGFTGQDVNTRIGMLQTGNPFTLYLVDQFHSPTGSTDEKYLHRILKSYAVGMGGGREWFSLTDHSAEVIYGVFSMPGVIPIAISNGAKTLDELERAFYQCCQARGHEYLRKLDSARIALASQADFWSWLADDDDDAERHFAETGRNPEPWGGGW